MEKEQLENKLCIWKESAEREDQDIDNKDILRYSFGGCLICSGYKVDCREYFPKDYKPNMIKGYDKFKKGMI